MSSYRRFQYGAYKPNNYRINNNNSNNNNSTIENFSNNFFNNNLNYQKDAFKAKIEYQHSRLTGDHINLIRNTSNHKIKNSMNHSNSTNRLLGNKNKNVYSNNFLKNYANNLNNNNNNVNFINNNNNNFNSGNLNNNNNDIINNLLLNSNINNNNNKSLNVINNNNNNINSINNNSKIFSKLGNNIINNNNNNTININNSKKLKYNLKHNEKRLNKNNSISSTSGLENVLEDLMKMTKEKTINYNNNNKENINNININKQNNFDINNNNNNNNFNTINLNNFSNKNKEKSIEKNNFTFIACENIEFHYKLWTLFFLMEIHSENKNSLHNTIKKIINLLDSNFNKIEEKLNENINLEIFNNENLNNAYLKILKIYLVLIVYIKFLLIDFNFEMTIKSNIKRLISSINEQFLTLITNQIFPNFNQNLSNNTNILNILKQNQNCEKMDNEFLENFTKIIKQKHIKKTKENPNIFALNLINKHLELVISTIKQFSNNFFKIGYFKPIHSICIEIFRLIETLSINNIINSVIIGMLYYITHNNPEKKKNSISSNSNVLSALGFINVPSPFLPSLKNIIKYTLVLDLDETLVHYFYTPSGGTFLIRPFCYHFLYEMSKLFEIVIFTAAMKDYADSILDVLDPEKKYIKFRLYRSHTSISGMNFVKDLNKLGRDLNKVVIIDNLADNFKLQQNNGIQCGTWIEDMKDTQLMDIEIILKEIVKDEPEDLRIGIKKINGEIKKKIKRNILNPFKGLDVNKILKE